jgi:hypothetical protein
VRDSGAEAVFNEWLARYGKALEEEAVDDVADVFDEGGYWKDILAFTWAYRTFKGRNDIRGELDSTIHAVQPRRIRLAAGRTPPRALRRSARDVVEGFFEFDTRNGRAMGFARLLVGPEDVPPRAWIVLTTLHELNGYEERTFGNRPTGLDYSGRFGGPNWHDVRLAERSYADRDPEVLIVGAGQAGLVLGARFRAMGIDTLIVEQNARVGDNWRNRYHSLTLHNEVWANHLPFMPFPDSWPTFLPKDKLAGWLEAYAEAMELNVWCSATLVQGRHDKGAQRWQCTLRSAEGSERVVRPRHLVLAAGAVSGVPNLPSLPGLANFGGEVLHSSAYRDGAAYRGRHATVVGTGNSGHDVAQDLHAHGATVTMVQRSPTCVISLLPGASLVYSLYSEGPPIEDIDLITSAIPYDVMVETYQWLTKRTCSLDADLLAGLAAAGFETDFGEDDTGFYMMYLRRGGGYYINMGCSELVASKEIGLINAREIDSFTATGMLLKTGEAVPADVVVLATGYLNQQAGVRRLLGDDVADRVGPIWGIDEHGGMRNMWQPTPQPGFWVMGGSLIDCRVYSRYLALLIAAELSGIDNRRGSSQASGVATGGSGHG